MPERVNSGLQVSNRTEAVTQWKRVKQSCEYAADLENYNPFFEFHNKLAKSQCFLDYKVFSGCLILQIILAVNIKTIYLKINKIILKHLILHFSPVCVAL